MTVASVSVLICTHNRAGLLRETLVRLQEMAAPDTCRVEIVVVDNNSTDETQDVLKNTSPAQRYPVIALHEAAQGKSFALNHGLQCASGDVVALTDDDVLPERDWLQRIVDGFRQRDVSFVCGKVLPRWGAPPPADLMEPAAQAIWGPLALVDYGDEPLDYTERTSFRLPVGANLAFSRSILHAVGGWRTDLGKVNNSLIAGEDHEILFRLRQFKAFSGYYDPQLIVYHYVPPHRLTRAYFRKWFYWLGKTLALMLDDLYPAVDMSKARRIAGTPRFLWREALYQAGRYIRTRSPLTPPLTALIEELRLIQYCGLIAQCYQRRGSIAASSAAEQQRAPSSQSPEQRHDGDSA